ncbi:MAG: hypothetical protein RJB39_298 [Candidatus Parcubacteria bacterium]|jgi:ribonuclease HI
MFHQDTLSFYTDGSSRGNPGPGGWGCIAVIGHTRVIELGGKDSHTTNNKMELQAVIEAMKVASDKDVSDFKKVHVFSDSKYVLQGITEWIKNWKKNNWRTAAKKAVMNQELWQELDTLVETVSRSGKHITWTYVKGHSDNKYNERADVLATECADATTKELADKGTKVFYDGELKGWGLN